MTVISLPSAQLSSTNWTAVGAGTSHAALDEGVPDNGDTDYVRNTASTNSLAVDLDAVSDPGVDTGHVVRVSAKCTSGSHTLTVQLKVDDGATLVATFVVPLTSLYVVTTYTLSAAEASALASKYDDISLHFETTSDGSTGIHTRVTLAQLEVPTPGETHLRTTSLYAEVSALYLPQRTVVPLGLPAVLPNFPLHNWDNSRPIVETSYLTDVTETPDTGAEERLSLRDRPLRTISADWTGMGRSQSSKILMTALRMLHSRLPLPLYCEQRRTTQEYTGGDTLYLDTRYRRFYVGARIVIGQPEDAFLANSEIGKITELYADRVVLDRGFNNTHPVGSLVFPLVDAEAKLNNNFYSVTDFHGKSIVEFSEVHGPSALPPSAEDTLSTIVSVYNGIPVFRFPPDWGASVRIDPERPGISVPLGRAPYVELEGDRPRFVFSVSLLFENRQDFWEMLQFFDSRRGRANPFMFVNPSTFYSVLDLQAGYVKVSSDGKIEDHQVFLDYVFLELEDGSYLIRDIEDITEDGDDWRINFTSDFASIPTGVRRCGSAHLVRFDSDTLRESWVSTEVCQMSFTLKDLPTEVDVPIEGIIDPVNYGADINLPSLLLWASAAKNVSKATEEVYPAYERERLILGNDELNKAAFIDDSRLNVNALYALGLTFPEPFLGHQDPAVTGPPPTLTRFDNWKFSLGREVCEAPLGTTEWDMVYDSYAQWWGDEGFTIFWCGRLTKRGGGNDEHVLVWDGDPSPSAVGPTGFALGTDFVRVGGVKESYANSMSVKSDRIYTLRWKPSTNIRVYKNGLLRHEISTGVPASLSKAAGTYTKVHTGVAPDSDPGLNQDAKIGKNGFFNSFFVFKKALDTIELNLVGNYLARLYPAPWNDI